MLGIWSPSLLTCSKLGTRSFVRTAQDIHSHGPFNLRPLVRSDFKFLFENHAWMLVPEGPVIEIFADAYLRKSSDGRSYKPVSRITVSEVRRLYEEVKPQFRYHFQVHHETNCCRFMLLPSIDMQELPVVRQAHPLHHIPRQNNSEEVTSADAAFETQWFPYRKLGWIACGLAPEFAIVSCGMALSALSTDEKHVFWNSYEQLGGNTGTLMKLVRLCDLWTARPPRGFVNRSASRPTSSPPVAPVPPQHSNLSTAPRQHDLALKRPSPSNETTPGVHTSAQLAKRARLHCPSK